MTSATPPPPTLAAKLAKAFQALTSGLSYRSESDHPYRAFSAEMPKGVRLDPETFRTAARIPRRFEVTLDSADDFFTHNTNPEYQDSGEVIANYALLEAVMRATLTDLSHVRARSSRWSEQPRVRVYLIGRTGEGYLAGLRSIAIET